MYEADDTGRAMQKVYRNKRDWRASQIGLMMKEDALQNYKLKVTDRIIP